MPGNADFKLGNTFYDYVVLETVIDFLSEYSNFKNVCKRRKERERKGNLVFKKTIGNGFV